MTRTLLLIRHAQADVRGPQYPDDSLRPLVAKGHRQASALAELFERLKLRPERLFTSPYRRAVETAEPLVRYAASGHLELLEALTDDDYAQLLADLEAQLKTDDRTVALVGHEPYLSELSAWLLTGDPHRVQVTFRKAALLALEGPLAPGAMALTMLLPARVYKRLVDGG
jgi:phosphohistidine phosphatase